MDLISQGQISKEKKKTEFKEEKSDEGKQIPLLGQNYYSFSPTFWRFESSSSKDAGNFCTHSTNPSSHAASTFKVSSKYSFPDDNILCELIHVSQSFRRLWRRHKLKNPSVRSETFNWQVSSRDSLTVKQKSGKKDSTGREYN